MRCFVALDLPGDVRAALERAQERLRAAAPKADLRWVAAASLHLTLKFLGQVADERAAAVEAALEGVGRAMPPIALACTGLGVFPGPRRPRVVWAGISSGLREIGVLASALERALDPVGFRPEGRPFRGHTTLGRVRSQRGLAPLAAALEAASGEEFGRWTATEIVLYRSHLRSTGSVYEPLARLPLAGAVV
jgi:2'-5' RNA ligase